MKTQAIYTYFLLFAFILLSTGASYAQQTAEATTPTNDTKRKFDPGKAILISPIFTAQWPFGNMADRFGYNSLFGLQTMFKVKKNWIVGLEGSFLFGTKLRENYVIDHITTQTGLLIGQENELIGVKSQEQGFSIKFNVGKVIPFSHKFPDAGLLVMTSVGFLQHKIALNVRESVLPQLDKTYRKGYDRMSNGPVISQFIGGIFLARRKFISMYGGLQFDVGFTEGRRPFDFYEGKKLNDKRIDMFLGVRIGWILPIFLQESEKEFYYY